MNALRLRVVESICLFQSLLSIILNIVKSGQLNITRDSTVTYKNLNVCSSLIAHRFFARQKISPRAVRADSSAAPPLVNILIPLAPRHRHLVVQHRAHATPKKRIDELTGALPPKVRIIQLVVLVEHCQIFGQLLGRRKLIYVNVRSIWGCLHIILRPGAHHDRQNIPV